MHELATDPEQTAPAQTAAMEAAWFLGNLAGLNDGTGNKGLSEVRTENQFEALTADDEAKEGASRRQSQRQHRLGRRQRATLSPGRSAGACGGCEPVGCRRGRLSEPGGRPDS